ncbi:WecB/TagA/CpsF family glycosyltransferase [Dietzia sp. B32]|uniref:WecB/TagA/CpsF family glycosyltransferase n=1 Tax=Dietzia sp. B32 TaxID=2915130 RepID=UPI0021AE0598|nr:WecB/TagA/CpsF family glycosyltransferase [Dietzia sp. B32]UVE96042.1 WecB/TagA/CpsF family glycosyltransferase [Dietzia sp. B32]
MANGMNLAGVTVTRATQDDVVTRIGNSIRQRPSVALAVGSVNLDHLHHFPDGTGVQSVTHPVEWLWLADGMPIAWRGRTLTGLAWPRVTGADLLPAILSSAENSDARVGWLGGTRSMHDDLAEVMAQRWPRLDAGSVWAPSREELDDPDRARAIVRGIAAAQVDILVVALGKPRQEQWIDTYGALSGARVLLAFGASGDFLAGRVARAPQWMQKTGAEWLYRLYREPRRLARRYLIEGPQQFKKLRGATLDA